MSVLSLLSVADSVFALPASAAALPAGYNPAADLKAAENQRRTASANGTALTDTVATGSGSMSSNQPAAAPPLAPRPAANPTNAAATSHRKDKSSGGASHLSTNEIEVRDPHKQDEYCIRAMNLLKVRDSCSGARHPHDRVKH